LNDVIRGEVKYGKDILSTQSILSNELVNEGTISVSVNNDSMGMLTNLCISELITFLVETSDFDLLQNDITDDISSDEYSDIIGAFMLPIDLSKTTDIQTTEFENLSQESIIQVPHYKPFILSPSSTSLTFRRSERIMDDEESDDHMRDDKYEVNGVDALDVTDDSEMSDQISELKQHCCIINVLCAKILQFNPCGGEGEGLGHTGAGEMTPSSLQNIFQAIEEIIPNQNILFFDAGSGTGMIVRLNEIYHSYLH
jgi:hypothetical protein